MDRGAAVGGAVVAFFAAGWFSWGQAASDKQVQQWLSFGRLAAILVGVVSVILVVRSKADGGAWDDPGSRRRYRLIVITEFTSIGIGAALLGVTGESRYIPVWVCAVVGVHFFPLGRLFGVRAMDAVAAALCAVAAAALVVGLSGSAAPSTVTGIGAGLTLLVSAVLSILPRASST